MKVQVGIDTGNVDSTVSKKVNTIWDNFFYTLLRASFPRGTGSGSISCADARRMSTA